MATDFDCTAYGLELPGLCFFEMVHRSCFTLGECETRMAAERARLRDRIEQLAATGNPDWVYVAGKLEGQQQLAPDRR